MGKFNPPKIKTGGSWGNKNQNPPNFIVMQARSQAGQNQVGEEIPVGRTDPFTGVRTETPEGQDFAVTEVLRKKASEDALKLQQALPILDDLERSYDEAYKNYQGATSGMNGALGSTNAWFQGAIMRQNPALRNFIDKVGQYEAPLVKLTGDVGNFSASERSSAAKGVPKVTPNTDINRLFLPDDIEYGKSKISSLKQLYGAKYMEAKTVAETGKLSPGYSEWANYLQNSAASSQAQQQTSPIPGMQQQTSGGDKRSQYNQLRAQGIPADEAKRRLGF